VTLPLAPIADDAEHEAFTASLFGAFGWPPLDQEQLAGWRSIHERDRSIAARDGTQIVGTAGAFSHTMAVPGAQVRSAGVTVVSVTQTHRRRGVLRSMMTSQLADVRDRGEGTAALWASEVPIYTRYGYGIASWHCGLDVETHRSSYTAEGAAVLGRSEARLRQLPDAEGAVAPFDAVLRQVAEQVPGTLVRPRAVWLARTLRDTPHDRGGATPQYHLLAEAPDGTPLGYALYRILNKGTAVGSPDGVVQVTEVQAVDAPTAALLWRHLLDTDLCTSLVARLQPLAHPLLLLLADPRRTRSVVKEGLLVRVVDLPKALQGRHYAAAVDVVLQVADPVCPWNEGRWRVVADTDGPAEVTRTDADADLVLGASELGASYLGSTTLTQLARAGRVAELVPGTLRAASRALSWDVPAFCPEIF